MLPPFLVPGDGLSLKALGHGGETRWWYADQADQALKPLLRAALGSKWRLANARAMLPSRAIRADWHPGLSAWLRSHGVRPGRQMVIQRGTPGLYRKFVTLVLNDDGKMACVLKSADTPESALSILNEHQVLTELHGAFGPHCRVPAVIGYCECPDRAFSAQAPCGIGNRAMSEDWTGLHHAFCAALHAATRRNGQLPQAIALREGIRQGIARHAGSDRIDAVCTRLLAHAARALDVQQAVVSRVHRDFTPWNCLPTERGMAVLDWEWSDAAWTPLADYFHYRLFPGLLRNKSSPPWSRIAASPSLAGLADTCGISGQFDAHAALYLYDLILFYAHAVTRERGKSLRDPLLLRIAARSEDYLRQWPAAH